MTSPDKRRFAQKLFAHDDKINAKVGQALKAAISVENRTLETIDASRQVIAVHEQAQQKFANSISQHIERTCQNQSRKYQGKSQRTIEPNLTKRMQARKDREALVALRNQASNIMLNNSMVIRTEPS